MSRIFFPLFTVCTSLYDVRTFVEENEDEFASIIANIRKILAADDNRLAA